MGFVGDIWSRFNESKDWDTWYVNMKTSGQNEPLSLHFVALF